MSEITNGRFAGKVALVTGGSMGIGLATAKAFALEGAKVVIAARTRETGDAAVSAIADAGGQAHFIATDMSDRQSVKDMVAETVDVYGGLDIAFNNAGISGNTALPISDADEEDFDRVVALNVNGVWIATKYQFREMIKRGGGSIVICGSFASIRGASDAHRPITPASTLSWA